MVQHLLGVLLAVVLHSARSACLPLGASCVQLHLKSLEAGQDFPQHAEITRIHPQHTDACKIDLSNIPTEGYEAGTTYNIKITSDVVAPATDVNIPDGLAMMWEFGTLKGDTFAATSQISQDVTVEWTASNLPMESFYAVCGVLGNGKVVQLAAPLQLFNKIRKFKRPPKLCPPSGTQPSGCSYQDLGCTVENSATKLNCHNQTIWGNIYITNIPRSVTHIDLSVNEILEVNPKSWKRWVHLSYWYGTGYWKPFPLVDLDLSENLITNVDNLLAHTKFPCAAGSDMRYCEYTIGKQDPSYGMGQWGLSFLERLQLQNNFIASIPYDMFEVSDVLDYVNLNTNPLDFIEANCQLSTDTDTLDCNNKLAEDLHYVDFHDVPRVHTIDFSHNSITSISPATWLHSVDIVRNIDVSYNKLSNMNLAKGLPQLRRFQMNNNLVSSLVFNQFEDNPLLNELNLEENPLDFLENGCTFSSDQLTFDCASRTFSEVQTLTITGATSGSFVLSWGNEDTTVLQFDATAQNIKDALNVLTTIVDEVNVVHISVTSDSCTDSDSGTTCNAHNANSATCISTARTDAAGATCVFAAAVASCTDPDTGTTCNAYNADESTCTTTDGTVARNDAGGSQCVFDAAGTSAATCTDSDAGITCNAHNADSPTCISRARTDNAGATCIFSAATTTFDITFAANIGNVENVQAATAGTLQPDDGTATVTVVEKIQGSALVGAVDFQDVPSLRLKFVNMANNQISTISTRTFGDSISLVQVDLSNNIMVNISTEMLTSSGQTLSRLFLQTNQLTTINSLTDSLTELTILRLDNNLLNTLSPWQFDSNKKLTVVKLSPNNNLDWLLAGCLMNDALTILDCKSLNIADDVNFLDIPSCRLEKIDFADNQITSLDPNMWYPANTTLEELYLSGNLLTQLDGLTDGMIALMKLYITRNPVERIPFRDTFLGHLPEGAQWHLGFSFQDGSKWLEDLHCERTETIKDVDGKKICYLEYCNAHDDLRADHCGGATCDTLDQAVACKDHWYDYGMQDHNYARPNVDACVTQEIMDCSAREIFGKVFISDIPDTVTDIDFSNNLITGIDHRTWNKLVAVRSIKFNTNDISNITGLMEGLDELKTLHIQQNDISYLPPNTFRGSRFLTDLDIDGNPLDFLNAGCTLRSDANKLDCSSKSLTGVLDFIDVPIVEFMDFSSNEITGIHPEHVWGASKDYLKELRLNNNNIGPNIYGYIDMMGKLETLTLAHNNLNKLGALAFVHNRKLTQVTVNGNPLDFVQSGCVLNTDASELDCSARSPRLGPSVQFTELPRATIRHMDFSDNDIIDIDKNMWKSVTEEELSTLELTKNMTGLDYHIRPLEKLQLQINEIVRLNHFFDDLAELKTLFTYRNPIEVPLPTLKELVGNNTKLTEAQMGFCYRGGCRFMDIGCHVDNNPPRFLAGTMPTPVIFGGLMTPSNPNFITKGPTVPKLVVEAGKIEVTKCNGETSSSALLKCKPPSAKVRSLSNGHITVFGVSSASGLVAGDQIQINIDQWQCKVDEANLVPCKPTDFVPNVYYVEVTLVDDDLELEALLECSNKDIAGHVFIFDLPYHVQRLRMNNNLITSIDPITWKHEITNYRYRCVTDDNKVVVGRRKVHVDEGQDRFNRAVEDGESFTSTPLLGSTCAQVPNLCEDCGIWLESDESTGELEELWLMNNKLTNITGYTVMLDKLETFMLDNNDLTFLDPRQLITLQHLREVSLLENELDFIENNCILSGNGRELDCSNKFLSGSINWQDIPELEHLDFSHNTITSMNPKMWDYSKRSLKSLRLNHNQLNDISEYTSNLQNVEKITLNDNNINHLAPNQFEHNRRLTFLNVYNNQLDFQLEGCQLETDGTTLDCHDKGLTGFVNFTSIPSYTIKRMDFGFNSYCDGHPRYFDQWLCEHETPGKDPQDLKDESGNFVFPQVNIPAKPKYNWIVGISGLGSQMWDPWNREGGGTVEELYLQSNELVDITGYTRGLPLLREFDASRNNITVLHPRQFKSNVKLERIGLAFNNLARIDKELFKYNPYVHTINLLSNKLDSLAYYQFKFQIALEKLYLGKNQLRTLELARFDIDKVRADEDELNAIGKGCQCETRKANAQWGYMLSDMMLTVGTQSISNGQDSSPTQCAGKLEEGKELVSDMDTYRKASDYSLVEGKWHRKCTVRGQQEIVLTCHDCDNWCETKSVDANQIAGAHSYGDKECETWWPANLTEHLPTTGYCGSKRICERKFVVDSNDPSMVITRLKKTYPPGKKCPPDLTVKGQATAARLTWWACE
jgi:Leucine-rich repeat (LRR) protein